MRIFNYLWILLPGLIFQSQMVQAQLNVNASYGHREQNQQIAAAIEIYEQQFSGPNSPVYHGYQYVPFILPARGDPFYPTNKWHEGAVDFEGKVYPHVFLLYDILKDQLVLQSANKLYRILLSKKKVSWFTLDSLRFIKITEKDSDNNDLPPAGYYEQVIQGPVQLLIKRKKSVEIPTVSGTLRSFASQNIYYIKKGNSYHKVRSRHSVLKVLSDQKRAIRRYLRKNKIYFTDNRENAIRQAVIFYNKKN